MGNDDLGTMRFLKKLKMNKFSHFFAFCSKKIMYFCSLIHTIHKNNKTNSDTNIYRLTYYPLTTLNIVRKNF